MSLKTLKQLYWRESKEQLVDLHEVDDLDIDSADLEQWQRCKRAISESDVSNSHWIKTCTGGYITEVCFHSDGTLEEFRLFDRFATKGCWKVEDGLLNVDIYKGENHYHFSVVGNGEINIHSAVEYKNGELHSYLKLAQVKA
jgi:hypothetical protein